MSTKRKLSPNAKTRKNIKRIKAQKAVLDRSRSSNSINSAATKSSNTLVLGGANRFMPERYHNIMEVIDTTNTVLGTGGGTTAGVVYTANGIFDYTTTLGNNDVPGYSLLSPIYRNWRVKGIRIDYTASNTSSDPVIMQVAMFPLGSGAFATWAALMNLSSNKWAKQKLLAAKGGNDTGKLSLYVNLAQYIGSTYKTDLDWTGTTNSSGSTAGNPANRLEARCYALSADGTTVVATGALKLMSV